MMAGGSSYTVYVYLHPEGEVLPANQPPGKPTVTPKLQSEIDKGIEEMRRKQYDEARTHLDKAARMAPGNPDIQYLLGMLEYTQQHFDVARAKFESALSIYPTHERALVSLGEVQLRSGNAGQAAETLEKAFKLNGADWRTHYLLAYAYAGQKSYEKARQHAERAAELNREHGASARLLLGRILLAEGTGGGEDGFRPCTAGFPERTRGKRRQSGTRGSGTAASSSGSRNRPRTSRCAAGRTGAAHGNSRNAALGAA
jgi:tetratricopeptide (TPR) repeat protein